MVLSLNSSIKMVNKPFCNNSAARLCGRPVGVKVNVMLNVYHKTVLELESRDFVVIFIALSQLFTHLVFNPFVRDLTRYSRPYFKPCYTFVVM